MHFTESSRRRLVPRRLAPARAGSEIGTGSSKTNRSCSRRPLHRRNSSHSKGQHATRPSKSKPRFQSGQQYSITALTDSTGTIKERYAYTAYGQLTITDASGTARSSTSESNRYTYTGREWDDVIELYHYRARMYDPLSGRFLSRDPIGYSGSEWNQYEFVKSAPVVGLDPSGLRPVCCGFVRGWIVDQPFGQTVECQRGRSAMECCKAFANGPVFDYRVKAAVEGPCKQKIQCGPVVLLLKPAQSIQSSKCAKSSVPGTAVLLLATAICWKGSEEVFPKAASDTGAGGGVNKPRKRRDEDDWDQCDFYYAWCKWGVDPNNNDKGPIWDDWGGNITDCLDCYAKCKKTKQWPHHKCLPNGEPEGPRWGDDVWPPGHPLASF